MLADIPAVLVQIILADATKASLQAVAATCKALCAEARTAASRFLIISSPNISHHTAQAVDASSSGDRAQTVHAETKLLLMNVPMHLTDEPPPVVMVSDCALLEDGTICVADEGQSKLIRMSRGGDVLGQIRLKDCWPRALAVTRENVFVTTMPADVDTSEAPDYPSSRVVRVAMSQLLSTGAAHPSERTEGDELQWCQFEDEADAADDDDWGECSTEMVPISLAASAQRLFVLHRQTDVGARPWEYLDEEWEDSPDSPPERTKRPLPLREHSITVFGKGATRPLRTLSLGEWPKYKAPQGLVEHKGLLYVNQKEYISVVDPKGGDVIRTFSLTQPGWILEPRERCFFSPLEIHDFAVVNGRVYSRDGTVLRVCDLDGKLMQSVDLVPDSHSDRQNITRLIGAENAKKVRVRWNGGLLVDVRQLHFFSSALACPGFTNYHGPSALVMQSVGVRGVA